jgi:AcrR family transcriptional regulator
MDTRTALLDAALNRFSAFGYDGTAVQEICDDCGLTKPTLYHHFSSKRGLLDALLAANFRPLWPPLQDACTYQHDLPLSLERVLRVFFTYSSAHPVFYRFQLSLRFLPLQSEASIAARPYIQKQEEFLIQLFKAAAADHGNMRGHSRSHALSFLGMLNTYITQALDGQQTLDDPTLFRARQQFMYGIFS